LQLEKDYLLKLIIEVKLISDYILQFGEEVFTVNGVITYMSGHVRSGVHLTYEAEKGNQEEDVQFF
jgi:hypothetical protein